MSNDTSKRSNRKLTGVTRINKATQARLFHYIEKNLPITFSVGKDSAIVTDAVNLWLDLMEAYTLPEFSAKHDGKTPAEVVRELLKE